MTVNVKISDADTNAVQAMFYEYNALCDILKRLSADETVQDKYIDKFTKDSVELFTKLEKLKDEVTNKYAPNGPGFTYNFKFTTNEIEYTYA